MYTEVKNQLAAKWQIDLNEYWIPLSLKEFPEIGVNHYKLNVFKREFGLETLNQLINAWETKSVYEFIQFGEENKSETLTISIRAGEDVFYTNQYADWVIYITHKGTITIAGKALLEQIKEQWPNWTDFQNSFFKKLN